MGCEYDLERPYAGDCAGCPATYKVAGEFRCKVEDGLMSVSDVVKINKISNAES